LIHLICFHHRRALQFFRLDRRQPVVLQTVPQLQQARPPDVKFARQLCGALTL
jgi:hypothetical protein